MTLFVEKFPVAHIHVQNHSVAYAFCALKKKKKGKKPETPFLVANKVWALNTLLNIRDKF